MRALLFGLTVLACLVAGCDGDGNATGSGATGGGGTGMGAGGTGGSSDTSGGTGGTGGQGASGGGGGCDAVGTNRVFVTSLKYVGDFGGLIAGDALCQARADEAALCGTWMAWLGDGVDGPASRFVHSTAPYNRVGGGVLVQNWDDLIDGTLEVPINQDESGTPLPVDDDMIVFTAVFHTGGNPTPVNCMGWTDAASGIVPTGLASATDTGWTVTAPHDCSEAHHLYCFEQ